MAVIEAARLLDFSTGLLHALGVPKADARLVAECLVEADLEGQAAHGVQRLPLYASRVRDGLIEARAQMNTMVSLPAAAVLDAGNGLGPIAGVRAMQLAVAKAKEAGAAIVAVRHSNHLGSLSFYVRRAAEQGCVGLAFTNTPPAMAPPGGRTPYLGTNPIAAGFPTSDEPVVVDLATSQVARGRILVAARSGRQIPAGWATDSDGLPTTDPKRALDGGVEPLGGPKGFALALIVEALSGVLSGAGIGPEVGGTYLPSDRRSNVGHCFGAIAPDALEPGFRERMDALAAGIRSVETIDPEQPVRLPGDRRRQERLRRQTEGVELSARLIEDLNRLAREARAAELTA